ncbi:MAG: hypothetical protein M1285_02515 [Candidatus Thermoplasmatota archaeon]|jgi:transposase-like protein|nr:hypothetical protein [Candidatus Thermoplasmatota archaeon]
MSGKTYTVEEKYNIVMESLKTDQSIAQLCRMHHSLNQIGVNMAMDRSVSEVSSSD